MILIVYRSSVIKLPMALGLPRVMRQKKQLHLWIILISFLTA